MSSRASPADSPHARGWTPAIGRPPGRLSGFPARAGMDLFAPWANVRRMRIPRTRGDGPFGAPVQRRLEMDSPHARGWTRQYPAPARAAAGFPARAGMDPRSEGSAAASRGGFPARAGMDPRLRVARPIPRRIPRTRGDGPIHVSAASGAAGGFPARAGMDRASPRARSSSSRIPRTRGDGPLSAMLTDVSVAGFPARAGMDPAWSRCWPASARIPRTRGDGPS